MRLSEFILDQLEPILQEWDDFASTVDTPLPPLDSRGLRNHAEQILRRVASDMRTSQPPPQQNDMSQGYGLSDVETPAQTHGVTRLVAGFSLDQMVSEYRALRASVLGLWLAQESKEGANQVQEMVRFNAAIDQALAESISSYGQAVDTTRKMVLGVLGHDLRSPLSAVTMGADLLRKSQHLDDREKTIATQVAISVRHANHLVNDLLDFARCNLGTGIPISRVVTELHYICQATVDELRTGHPHARIVFNSTDKVVGLFDPERVAQIFTNLISNAVRHGDPQQPIHVTLKVDGAYVFFTVLNFGEPIPSDALPILFSPEGRYSRYSDDKRGETVGLGLGLFIAAEIVAGHGGEIEVESTLEQGTIFRVSLPISTIPYRPAS
ncbi:ATP-binding protein [Pseudomonas sp. GZD-222]|uniref:ATP-binding protein n=1 Tax=Pseudomonas sp. GZD-222 TaxID=3404805 RepID=UPI003BB6F046